jgi:transcriptional regulator with XRE-family HTH domain
MVRHAEATAGLQAPEGVSDAAAKSLQGAEIRAQQGSPYAGGAVPPEPTVSPVRRKAVELSAFFERLRQVLDDRAMSQADLARELNVGVATVSEWFTRGRVPNGDVMLRLPAALRVNGHWLLTGEGPRERDATPGGDPYRRGAEDALARMAKALDEVARRFGPSAAHGMDPPEPGST